MERYPQAKENVRVARRELSDAVRHEVDRLNAELAGEGRVLVRPSGTEPVIRVLAEAETTEKAAALCASISGARARASSADRPDAGAATKAGLFAFPVG